MAHARHQRVQSGPGYRARGGARGLRCWSCSAVPAAAQRIENSVAVFAALDKVTAKISRLEVPLNQTATFGALKVTPRVCYTRAPTEPPKTTTFVEVEEIAARRQGEADLLRLDVRRQPRPQRGGASGVRRVADGLRAAARHRPASAAGRLRHPARLRHRRRPPIPTTPSPSAAAACRGSLVSDRWPGQEARAPASAIGARQAS